MIPRDIAPESFTYTLVKRPTKELTRRGWMVSKGVSSPGGGGPDSRVLLRVTARTREEAIVLAARALVCRAKSG
jgi:hypothetical protein